jgi:hypothetical protein
VPRVEFLQPARPISAAETVNPCVCELLHGALLCSIWYCFFKRLSPFFLAEKLPSGYYAEVMIEGCSTGLKFVDEPF